MRPDNSKSKQTKTCPYNTVSVGLCFAKCTGSVLFYGLPVSIPKIPSLGIFKNTVAICTTLTFICYLYGSSWSMCCNLVKFIFDKFSLLSNSHTKTNFMAIIVFINSDSFLFKDDRAIKCLPVFMLPSVKTPKLRKIKIKNEPKNNPCTNNYSYGRIIMFFV